MTKSDNGDVSPTEKRGVGCAVTEGSGSETGGDKGIGSTERQSRRPHRVSSNVNRLNKEMDGGWVLGPS
jgi:hypothetical protein